jgi:hypothetical protein
MIKRLLGAILLCGLFAAAPAHAAATGLSAQLFPLTGEVRLLNKTDTPVPFVFYSIESASGALQPSSSIWKSISENYDQPSGPTPGNGFIDPNASWTPIFATSTELTEGVFDLDGGALPGYRAISLGKIWDPHLVAFPDLVFDIQDDLQSIPVTIELALDGDYSNDQVVDQSDYIVWRKYLDSLEAYFADGDIDGVVDLDDRLVWQQNFGVTLPLPPYGIGGGNGGSSPVAGGVPEPSSAMLAALASGLLPIIARRRGR